MQGQQLLTHNMLKDSWQPEAGQGLTKGGVSLGRLVRCLVVFAAITAGETSLEGSPRGSEALAGGTGGEGDSPRGGARGETCSVSCEHFQAGLQRSKVVMVCGSKVDVAGQSGMVLIS